IVGVARDPKHGTLVDGLAGLYVYVPLQQQYLRGFTTLVVRTADGRSAIDEIRTLVRAMDPQLSLPSTQTAEEYTSVGIIPQRVAMSVAGSLGGVGLLLATIGIYAVTAYAVARRTREIGIHVALGASTHVVMRTWVASRDPKRYGVTFDGTSP